MAWNIVIGFICTVLGATIAVLSFSKAKSKEDKCDGQQTGTILTEIGYIKGGVDDIKRKQDRQDENNLKLSERVTAVEQSSKQAHYRIDRMEGRKE